MDGGERAGADVEDELCETTKLFTQLGGMGGVGGSGGTPRLEGIPLPEDLLMEVMLRLDWASVGRLARCCMRLKTLAVDDKLWQRLAHTVCCLLPSRAPRAAPAMREHPRAARAETYAARRNARHGSVGADAALIFLPGPGRDVLAANVLKKLAPHLQGAAHPRLHVLGAQTNPGRSAPGRAHNTTRRENVAAGALGTHSHCAGQKLVHDFRGRVRRGDKRRPRLRLHHIRVASGAMRGAIPAGALWARVHLVWTEHPSLRRLRCAKSAASLAACICLNPTPEPRNPVPRNAKP
jgi:hypothetical protein